MSNNQLNQNITVGFLGLGIMGYPMAGHVAKAGYNVKVYNRSMEKTVKWCQQYAAEIGENASIKGSETLAQLASECDVVMACVGGDDDLRNITIGEQGVFQTMKSGSVFVDHTTTSATVAKEVYAIGNEKNIGFVDAPVSGGEVGAQNGVLTVMCGGDSARYDQVEPIIRSFAKAVKHMGPVGNGQLTKMVNQICIAGLIQGLSEGVCFGQRVGLDIEDVLDIIGKGAAQSWQMDNRGKTMYQDQFDFGFAVDWMRKDLKQTFEEANRLQISLPVTALVDQFYAEIQGMGGGRWDTSSLIKRLPSLNS